MTGGVLLIGVGVMLVLGGGVAAVATLLGVQGRSDRGTKTASGRRFVVKPIYAVGVVAGLVGLLLTGWVAVGVGVVGAVLFVPAVLGKSTAPEHIARLEALGSWTRRLADLLASGAAGSLERALTKSAAIAPAAICTEVSALAARIGPQGTRTALLAFAQDMADPVSDEVVMSLILQLRHGGRGLAAVLSDLAAHVEDQIRMRRGIEADRAKPRSNVRTIVLLTLGLSAGFILLDRPFLEPYGTPVGQAAFLGVVAIFAAAMVWLRRIVRLTPGERLLSDQDFAAGGRR